MAAGVVARPVLVAVVHHAAVVAAEEDQRVVGQAEPVEGGQDLADRPVELLDRVAAGAALAGPLEPRVRDAGDVDVVRVEVEEERPVLVPLDEGDGLAGDRVGHVLVLPARRLAAGHVADPADAVDDRVVVAVARLDLEQLRVVGAGRLVADRRSVADLDRVVGVIADDPAVFDVDARHAVAGGRDDERVVESDLARPGRDRPVVVGRRCAEAEVPLADDARGVAGLLEELGRVSVSSGIASGATPLRIDAPGRCRQAYCPVMRLYRVGVQTEACGMGIGEAHPLGAPAGRGSAS